LVLGCPITLIEMNKQNQTGKPGGWFEEAKGPAWDLTDMTRANKEKKGQKQYSKERGGAGLKQ